MIPEWQLERWVVVLEQLSSAFWREGNQFVKRNFISVFTVTRAMVFLAWFCCCFSPELFGLRFTQAKKPTRISLIGLDSTNFSTQSHLILFLTTDSASNAFCSWKFQDHPQSFLIVKRDSLLLLLPAEKLARSSSIYPALHFHLPN